MSRKEEMSDKNKCSLFIPALWKSCIILLHETQFWQFFCCQSQFFLCYPHTIKMLSSVRIIIFKSNFPTIRSGYYIQQLSTHVYMDNDHLYYATHLSFRFAIIRDSWLSHRTSKGQIETDEVETCELQLVSRYLAITSGATLDLVDSVYG